MDLLQKAWDIKIENLSAGYRGIRLWKNNFVKSFSGAYSCAKR